MIDFKWIFVLICCRALLPPDITCNSCLFDKYHGKKAGDYDVPCATSISDDQVYPCSGLFKLERWKCLSSQLCRHVIQPFRQQTTWVWNSLLWHLSQELYFYSRFCFCIMNEYICVFHFLFVLFVISLILPDLVYKCTLLNFMEVQAQLSNLFPLITILRIKLLLYNLVMWFLYYHYFVISDKCFK